MGISPDAVAGFVGVVTGAITTGGFQFGMVVRSERRDRRAARRSVRNELFHAKALLDYAITDKLGWQLIVSDVNTEAWDRYADDLARDRKVDFVKVAAAYRAIQGLHRIVPMGTPEPDFSALATKTIGDAVDHLSKV